MDTLAYTVDEMVINAGPLHTAATPKAASAAMPLDPEQVALEGRLSDPTVASIQPGICCMGGPYTFTQADLEDFAQQISQQIVTGLQQQLSEVKAILTEAIATSTNTLAITTQTRDALETIRESLQNVEDINRRECAERRIDF